MKKSTFKAVMLVTLSAMVLFTGCKRNNNKNDSEKKASQHEKKKQSEVTTGGNRDDSDYDAPKVIESDELVMFETKFFRFSDYVYDVDREYRFKMAKSEDGVFTITEGDNEELKCDVDDEFAKELQQIIREYNLPELNGIDKQTFGLAPECAPYWVEAEYETGEKLSFYMDGNPYAEWSYAVLDLFAREFGRHGIDDLLPVKEESAITLFTIEYAYDDIIHMYGEVYIQETDEDDSWVKMLYADPWDRTGKTQISDNRKAYITEEYYSDLKKIVDDNEVFTFQNGETIPGDFDYSNTPQYFEFYIVYENGNKISGFSDDPVKCEKFKKIAELLGDYHENYLEKNKL